MKSLIVAVIIFFMGISFIQAQEELAIGELIINFENRPASWNITVKIEACGAVWNQYHELTTEFLGGEASYSQNSQRMFHASDLDWSNQGLQPILSLGNYEVSIWEGGTKRAWFFINYRTSHLPYAATLGEIDVVLDYKVINKNFVLTTPDLGNVINGSYFFIWELFDFVEFQTDDLELYLNVSSQNSHPNLQWNEYHEPNILGYNIYRKITLGAGGSQTNVIFTTLTSFLDENFEIGPPKTPGNDQVEYYIKAKISSTEESLEGNHVHVVGTSIIQWKISDEESVDDLYYTLRQNYPNPFNPSTIISWQSPVDDLVILKVFDVLGRQVITLVDEYREAGSHSIEFNASSLPSGVYLYTIQIGSYFETRKLTLLK